MTLSSKLRCDLVFQSYLYGIEMLEKKELSTNGDQCFNRTFMELKFKDKQGIKRSTRRFQSYLYGIEIDIMSIRDHTHLVSIVPLWNWNEVCSDAFCEINLRFNRTFMELKSKTCKTRIKCQNSFNRTFMELKFRQHLEWQ